MVHVKSIGRYSWGLKKHINKYAILYIGFLRNFLHSTLRVIRLHVTTEILQSIINIYNKYCMRLLSNVGQILKCTKSCALVVSIQEILNGIFYSHILPQNSHAFTVSVLKSVQMGGRIFRKVLLTLPQIYKNNCKVEFSTQTPSKTSLS